jgi:hypothetical protein
MFGDREPVMLPPALLERKPRVDQSIHRENIALYKIRILETSDAAARKVLLRLLAEEETKGDPLRSSSAWRWLESDLRPPR